MSKKSESIYSWVAGLVDGEGSIMLGRSRKTEFRSPQLSVSNTAIELLEPLQRIFGGRICNHGRRTKKHAVAYSWRLSHDQALMAMSKIYPFMQHPLKRKRIQFLIARYKRVTKRNGRYTEKELQRKQSFEDQFFQLS